MTFNHVRANIRNLLVGAPEMQDMLDFRTGRMRDGRWDEAEYADEFIREVIAEEPVPPRIPVNSVLIPVRFVRIASDWYGGMDCKLYAVCSTGNLTTGTTRPARCENDEEWYYSIWRDLSVDVGLSAEAARKGYNGESDKADAIVLAEFAEFVDNTVEQLAVSYGIED